MRERAHGPERVHVVGAVLALLALALAGCTLPAPEGAVLPRGGYAAMGFDGTAWPDLRGAKVRVLAYDSFGFAFEEAAAGFKELTNGTAELFAENDSGRVLERALRERGDPSFDVVYGLDNVLLGRAVREGALAPYQPLLASRIEPGLVFAPGWMAVPVNHGYIAVNVDPRANLTVRTLGDVRAHAARFVTEDPRTSTPGLGFMLATVATYGETGAYTWLDYWRDLFARGVLVTSGWTEAYAQRFTGGYGQFEEGAKVDKALVTSYTTSPAYEMHYGYDTLNHNVLAPKATFHQVQTMAITAGARNRPAAEAWVEYTLTERFQRLAASHEAIYPAVRGINVSEVYGGRDPAPGTFEDAGLSHAALDANVERWLRAWTDLYERSRTR